ncbi:MAG TPA: restriction endonuclease subunit S [Williamwhitmania sp.]|nr:restriction endonuclease subunit S [Williamwhitmania sp.]
MSWITIPLGEIITISKGKKHTPVDGGINRYINIENLHDAENSLFTNDNGVFVRNEDLIIAWDGANAGKVGVGFEGVIGSTLARLKLKVDNADPNYLFWVLESLNSKIKSQRTGATIPHVNGSALKEIEIPLPPLPIQKRIAEILDAADALKRKDQELLKKYDELAQSIFIDMFGDIEKNEKGWEVKRFDEVVDFPSGLVDPKISPYSEMYHVGGDNIESATGRIFGLQRTNELSLKSGKFYFTNKHILYNKIRPKLNKVTLPDFEGICSADMYPLLPKEKFLTKEYLYFILRSDSFLDFADKQSRRANIPKINMNEMSLFRFPIPPKKIQIRFMNQLERLNSISLRNNESSLKSKDLFNTLIQKAFNGELVAE